MRTAALLFALLFCAGGAHAASRARGRARDLVLKGDGAAAAAAYASVARGTQDAELAAEYAYALALAGYADAALAELDRALLLAPDNDAVRHAASAVLGALGPAAAAKEMDRPAPAWQATAPPPGPLKSLNSPADFPSAFASANLLMLQQRYLSAAARFDALTRKYPNEAVAWGGLAISLEQLGAYREAAKASAKDLELSKAQGEAREVKLAYQHDLEERPPYAPPARRNANDFMKGRYLSFFGGSLIKNPTGTVLNVNGRIGKFFTDRFDAAFNLGVTGGYKDSDYNGVNLGLSGRYSQPLPVDAPVNATAGARVEYLPRPSDKSAFILSPGLSYVLPQGSVDLYLDIALSGPFKDSQTLSLGYTAYFGGGQ